MSQVATISEGLFMCSVLPIAEFCSGMIELIYFGGKAETVLTSIV
jgi:hypothetical protein